MFWTVGKAKSDFLNGYESEIQSFWTVAKAKSDVWTVAKSKSNIFEDDFNNCKLIKIFLAQ